MRTTRQFKYTFACLLLAAFGLCSCSLQTNVPTADMMGQIEDLHIYESIQYMHSPFNALTAKTFTHPSATPSHYINILDIGSQALLARIHLIRNAQKAIYIQTFIWKNDACGRFLFEELIQAARRGVQVKVILDPWESSADPAFYAYLATASENIQIKLFAPFTRKIKPHVLESLPRIILDFNEINFRMHNKTFIVDDRLAITGGRNYQNDYYDMGLTRNYKDRDILIVGPIVREMTESFMQFWAFKPSIRCKALVDVAQAIESGASQNYATDHPFVWTDTFETLNHTAANPETIQTMFIDQAIKVEDIEFIADHPAKNEYRTFHGGSRTREALVTFLSSAEKSVLVQTPYLILDKNAVKTVGQFKKKHKDIDIQISTNSLAATDNLLSYAFSYKQKEVLVRKLGFRIFEFKPRPRDMQRMMPSWPNEFDAIHQSNFDSMLSPDLFAANIYQSSQKHLCLHAKTFIVDDSAVWIGTYNVHPRSAHLNTEMAIIIRDRQVACQVGENILRDIAPQNSWTIGKAPRIFLLSAMGDICAGLFNLVPFLDIWPFRYTASFELRPDRQAVPFDHDRFYERYKNVGSFPEVAEPDKIIKTRLIKALGGIAQPIM